jgi:hypothetical protein
VLVRHSRHRLPRRGTGIWQLEIIVRGRLREVPWGRGLNARATVDLCDSRYPPANLALKHQRSLSARPRQRPASRDWPTVQPIVEVVHVQHRGMVLAPVPLSTPDHVADSIPVQQLHPPSLHRPAGSRNAQPGQSIDDNSALQQCEQRGVSLPLCRMPRSLFGPMGASYQRQEMRA